MNNSAQMDQLAGLISAGRVAAPGALDGIEQQLVEQMGEPEDELQESALNNLKELLAVGRLAIKEMQVERDGNTLTVSLGHIEGLDRLPHLMFAGLGGTMMVRSEVMVDDGPIVMEGHPVEIDD